MAAVSSSSFHAGGDERVMKTGWLHKFSVGRGILPVKNWQKRWFSVNNTGLNYSKGPDVPAQQRTFIPFISKSALEVTLNPVFLLPTVSAALHPEAADPSAFYFGLRFEEGKAGRILLLRAESADDRAAWVRFLSQFLHVGSSSGIPVAHPLDSSIPRGHDPEQLDAREKLSLRSVILNWDEGAHLRQVGECPDPIIDVWDSDGDGDGHTPGGAEERSRRQSVHNATPSANHSGHSSPRPTGIPQNEYDCL